VAGVVMTTKFAFATAHDFRSADLGETQWIPRLKENFD
jgi:hypothetical protein